MNGSNALDIIPFAERNRHSIRSGRLPHIRWTCEHAYGCRLQAWHLFLGMLLMLGGLQTSETLYYPNGTWAGELGDGLHVLSITHICSRTC